MALDPDQTEIEFNETDFSAQDLNGITFEDCTFRKCNFKDAVLDRARFSDCTFISCDLSNLPLRNARLRKCKFEHCKLLGLQWTDLEDFLHPVFRDCNLNYSNFVGLKFKKLVATQCLFRDADFSQADLSEANFTGGDFLNARFHSTVLTKADFRKAQNYLIDPTDNPVKGARFSLPEAQGLLAGLGIVLD